MTDKTAARLTGFLEGRSEEMLALLEELVLIQSGSRNKAGVDRVGRVIRKTAEGLGLRVKVDRQTEFGHNLAAASPAAGKGKDLLLVGHMDTVFPEDTAFNWFRQDRDKAYGPGVADMKGGLVVGLFALKALAQAGMLAELPLVFLFNSDEEVGSPGSQGLIADLARGAAAAFVLECGGLKGEVVTGRKGRLGLELSVRGRAGHAAFSGPAKASAILELARKTVALEELNGLSPGLSVNVGQVGGGIGPNTVAEEAWARIDIRFMDKGEADQVQAELDRLAGQVTVRGTTSRMEVISSRPPMEVSAGNRFLYGIAAEVGRNMDLDLRDEFRQGVSDANLLARAGLPVLDGLGPVGGNDHSDREYILKSSLEERAKLLALTLAECHGLIRSGAFPGRSMGGAP